ncbi:MAG: HPr family phosphocarrier protein [Thermoguttaceae bacterium]
MSDIIRATREVAVTNEEGIHARAATLIAELVRRFDSKVEVIKDDERVESTDVLQVLSLGAAHGSKLSLEAVGGDAEEVLDALAKLISDNFSEN